MFVVDITKFICVSNIFFILS